MGQKIYCESQLARSILSGKVEDINYEEAIEIIRSNGLKDTLRSGTEPDEDLLLK